jgi:hypothetical protein
MGDSDGEAPVAEEFKYLGSMLSKHFQVDVESIFTD